MQDLHGPSVRCVRYAMLFVSVVLAVLLSSCSADLPLQREGHETWEPRLAAPYSIVCVIHGDGDYLYHDTSGNEYNAAEVALAGAKSVAYQNPRAEVFIFYQKPRRYALFLFPLHDGEFYYFRNGQLVVNKSYWRGQEQSDFDSEVKLYRSFHANNQPEMVSMFLYFGHEIPEFGGAGYDASYPDRPFTVQNLAGGLQAFTRYSAKFDLVILSTCFGGTPYTIGTLGSFARYIIASPDYLHLSYLDLHSLERLDLSLKDGDVSAFAKQFARKAFERLTSEVETTVSVAVYDVDHVQDFVHSVDRIYNHTLAILKGETQTAAAMVKHCDCADLPAYVLPTMNEGIDVFYRPARFGRLKHRQSHSGWECWSESGTPRATSQSSEPVQK